MEVYKIVLFINFFSNIELNICPKIVINVDLMLFVVVNWSAIKKLLKKELKFNLFILILSIL